MKEPTAVDLVISELDPFDKSIRASEGESIADRWEFGRILVKHRAGKKQLPRGWRAEITERFGLEASEITRRMQLAEQFQTGPEVVEASTRCGDSWPRLYREELTKSARKRTKTVAWVDSKNATANKWLREANGSDERHAALVEVARYLIRALGADVAEVAE